MEFTRTSPIQINTNPISGGSLVLKFIIKGSKNIIKINVRVHIYFKHHIHRNMINVVSSDTIVIHTFGDDRYKVIIKIPEFKDRTQSYITFFVDQNESLYSKVFIDSISAEFSKNR